MLAAGKVFTLTMITNRGVAVWPDGFLETLCTDHWRCRFSLADSRDTGVTRREVVELLSRLDEVGVDFVKTENLCSFDGEPGYSAGHTH